MVRKIYPPIDRVTLDGGLNTKFASTLIQDNESPDCLNVMFENGAVGTREGTTVLNSTAVGAYVCEGLFTRHVNNGNETMCAFFGSKMYTLVNTSFVSVPSAVSIFSSGERVFGIEYENYLFLGNGNISPYKYNESFTRHGIPAQTTTATVATSNSGVLSGSYFWKITNINSNLVESDVGPAIGSFSAASESVLLSAIPTAPASHGINSRKVYRTNAGSGISGTYYLVNTISNNTATTFVDNIADASLGTAAPTDQGEPPNFSFAVYHQDRLFMNDPANPNYLVYTELGNPYVVKASNYIKIGNNTFDILTGLAVYENGVVCTTKNGITIIYMPDTTASNWISLRGKSAFGSKSPFGIVEYNNKVLFPATHADKFLGFAALEGITIEPDTTFLSKVVAGSELKSNMIEPDMFNIQTGYLDNIAAITFKNKAYISVTYGAGNITNNRVYVFDYSISNLNKPQEFSWAPWTNINANYFTIYDGKLYYGVSDASGFVYQLNDGTYNDNGSAINSYFWTKEFSGDSKDIYWQKDFRYLQVLYDRPGNYDMEITSRFDGVSDDEVVIGTINLDPGGRKWAADTSTTNALIWGATSLVGRWGGDAGQGEARLYQGISGKRIQYKFSNSNVTDRRFKVYGLNYVYNLKGYR